MSEAYDVAVIGSGPGGYVAGVKAAQAGLRAAVIERDRLGGICLNWGCIPTKALLHNAELFEELKEASAYGFTLGEVGFDPRKIVERSRKVADKMSRGVQSLLKKYKVAHVPGSAKLLRAGLLEVTTPEGKPQLLEAAHIIVATGASPRSLPGIAIDHERVITYREALALTTFPKRLLIVGAGAIGVEFAYYFNAFNVEVHLVELLPQLLPVEDAEISNLLLRSFRKKGIACYTGTAVESLKVGKSKLTASLKGPTESTTLECDLALVAVGMAANTAGLGLEQAGVALERGFVKVDEHLRSSVPGIYAIGDVAGHQLLAHKASAEAEVAVAAIKGHAHPPLDYGQIPGCTYCQPQVASVGLTEEQCKQRGLKYRVGRFPMAASGKANALRQLDGMAKVIFGEPHGQLLGAHLIGPQVTELLAELGLALRLEATYEEILATVHAHPTLSETVFEATGVAYGVSPNL
ncbi:MAG: dihydrolipoyl dehydrogenase [Candidatus Lambdaproteobacteria bacterium]|nr:dihydrolipoyl dehydrogenase [Candidatus Lambdaproteobacteria bacterium]